MMTWGYGGAGPNRLAEVLVDDDALGALTYCPSCWGTIGVAAGRVQCTLCTDGMRPELSDMTRGCRWITRRSGQQAKPGLWENAPPGAQWHISRTACWNSWLARSLRPRR